MTEAGNIVELITKLGTSAIVAAYLFYLLLKQIKRIRKHVRQLRCDHKAIHQNLESVFQRLDIDEIKPLSEERETDNDDD